MTWGQLAEATATRRDTPPVHEPILTGFQTRDLAQITDAMIATQEEGPLAYNGLGVPAVYAVVRLIASTIDQLDLTVGDGPAPTWLRSPRRYGSSLDLGDIIQWSVTAMALNGAAYLRCTKIGDSWRIEAVHPTSVQPKNSASGVVAMAYLVNGQEVPTVPATMAEWGERVPYLLPIPYLVTPDFPGGLSPLTAARVSLMGYYAVERQAASLIDQGTYSGGRLETDQDITPATAERYQGRWIENRASGRLPVLGAGLRYVNDLISPRDAQWLESRQFNSQQVAMMYGVPPDYLGMTASGGSSSLSYANSQDNDRRFRRNCLEAFTSQIEDALSMLTPLGRSAGEAQDVRFDYSRWEASGGNSGDNRAVDSQQQPRRDANPVGHGGPIRPEHRVHGLQGIVRGVGVRPGDGGGGTAAVVPPEGRAGWACHGGDEHGRGSDDRGRGATDATWPGRDHAAPLGLAEGSVGGVQTAGDQGGWQLPGIPIRRVTRAIADAPARIFRRSSDRDTRP